MTLPYTDDQHELLHGRVAIFLTRHEVFVILPVASYLPPKGRKEAPLGMMPTAQSIGTIDKKREHCKALSILHHDRRLVLGFEAEQ
jgi:hypothetical protein